LDDAYNRVDADPDRDREVSLRLIREFVTTCKARGVVPIVAGIWPYGSTARVLDELAREGVHTIDIGATEPALAQNRPCDAHPGAAGHRGYADRLEPLLRSVLSP
jgi:hypothetical protein